MAAADRRDLLDLDLERAEAIGRSRLTPLAAARAADRARGLARSPTRPASRWPRHESVHELCVCDLAWVAERPQNFVSHHLRALRSVGIVESRREGKMVLYALTERGRSLLAIGLEAERETVR